MKIRSSLPKTFLRLALTGVALLLSLPLLGAASGTIWLALLALAMLPLWLAPNSTIAAPTAQAAAKAPRASRRRR